MSNYPTFYNSSLWNTTRNKYYKHVHGLCEQCGRVGEIVHHKVYIDSSTINKPEITLNWDNLILLCRSCHKKIHDGEVGKIVEQGLMFNDEGDITYEDKDI